jgi:hypothetical protein
MIIRASINTAKIDKSAMIDGKQGKYIAFTLLENRDGEDQYGNNFMIIQDIGKERRDTGEKGAILGNGKFVKANNPKPVVQAAAQDDEDDDIPF